MPAFRLFRPDSDPAPQTALTVRDVLAAYLRHSRANDVHGPVALAHRERTFGLFAAEYGDHPAADAKPFWLTDFVEAQPGLKSTASRRQAANAIKAAFNWAYKGERIDRHPFRNVAYAEAERRPDMPDPVIDRLCAAGNKRVELALRWLRLTGCRSGELCKLTWDQIDWQRGVWTIPAHKTRKKTGKPRVVVLVAEAVALLRQVAGAPATPAVAEPAMAAGAEVGSGFVFLNTRGKPWRPNTLYQWLWDAKRRGLVDTPASIHGIRHRAGSAMVAGGAPMKLVAQQLGHASVRTTEDFYCDVAGEIDALRAAAAKGLPKESTVGPEIPRGNRQEN